MWRTVASLSSLNQFTFTYLFRHARHSQRCMQWVSPPPPHPLSSSITLTDAMVNGWLEVTDTGLLFYIHVRTAGYWEYSFNTTATWETYPQAGVMTIIKWGENYYLSLSLTPKCTHTHSYTCSKCPHLPRKHLSETGVVNSDTTWLVLCISIAFCS